MTDLWWTAPGAGEPPLVELSAQDSVFVTLSLVKAVSGSETIENDPDEMTASLYTYRTRQPVDAAAKVGSLVWDNTAKKIAQQIDASKLPLDVPVVLLFRFRVNGSAGVEYRTAWVILRVVV